MKSTNIFGKDSNLFDSLVSVDRVSKVTKGGLRFAYRVLVLVGNGKGYVSHGMATHVEVSEAKIKAIKNAKSVANSINISLYEGRTIYHEVWGNFNSTKVFLKPAAKGVGLMAGGAVRKVCNVVGISDIVTKSYCSFRSHNVIMAVFNALGNICTSRMVANKRGKLVSEISLQRLKV